MGSVGNQKSKGKPGINLRKGIERGANRASAKNSLVGAKNTHTATRSNSGIALATNDCLYNKKLLAATNNKLRRTTSHISSLLLCNAGWIYRFSIEIDQYKQEQREK